MNKIAEEKRPEKAKSNHSLLGKELKTNDLLQASVGRARGSPQNQNQNPRIAYAKGRVKPLRGSYAALRPCG